MSIAHWTATKATYMPTFPKPKIIFFKPTPKTNYVDNTKIAENEYNLSLRSIIREIDI